MNSFRAGLNAVVVGASGGIGGALARALAADETVGRVVALSRQGVAFDDPKVEAGTINAFDEASVEQAARDASKHLDEIDLVVIAIGILQDEERGIRPERTWRALDPEAMLEVYRTNTIAPALVAKHFLPLLARGRRSVLAALSARVGSIGDNRFGGWHSYRSSKTALNMLIRCFAIELKRAHPDGVCVGLHPGTVDTRLSKPFQANVPDEQLASPEVAAAHLLAVIDRLGPEDSGQVFAWDGERVPA